MRAAYRGCAIGPLALDPWLWRALRVFLVGFLSGGRRSDRTRPSISWPAFRGPIDSFLSAIAPARSGRSSEARSSLEHARRPLESSTTRPDAAIPLSYLPSLGTGRAHSDDRGPLSPQPADEVCVHSASDRGRPGGSALPPGFESGKLDSRRSRAILIHGLGGCAEPRYVVRVASRALLRLKGSGGPHERAGRVRGLVWPGDLPLRAAPRTCAGWPKWLAAEAPGSRRSPWWGSRSAQSRVEAGGRSTADRAGGGARFGPWRPIRRSTWRLAAGIPDAPENRIYDRTLRATTSGRGGRLEAPLPDLEPVDLECGQNAPRLRRALHRPAQRVSERGNLLCRVVPAL